MQHTSVTPLLSTVLPFEFQHVGDQQAATAAVCAHIAHMAYALPAWYVGVFSTQTHAHFVHASRVTYKLHGCQPVV